MLVPLEITLELDEDGRWVFVWQWVVVDVDAAFSTIRIEVNPKLSIVCANFN